MKRNLKALTLAVFLVIAPMMMFAQPHPNGGTAPDGDNTKVGDTAAGAPVGSGTLILLTLAGAYASRKVYVSRTNSAEE